MSQIMMNGMKTMKSKGKGKCKCEGTQKERYQTNGVANGSAKCDHDGEGEYKQIAHTNINENSTECIILSTSILNMLACLINVF